jgi:hypothetical protein
MLRNSKRVTSFCRLSIVSLLLDPRVESTSLQCGRQLSYQKATNTYRILARKKSRAASCQTEKKIDLNELDYSAGWVEITVFYAAPVGWAAQGLAILWLVYMFWLRCRGFTPRVFSDANVYYRRTQNEAIRTIRAGPCTGTALRPRMTSRCLETSRLAENLVQSHTIFFFVRDSATFLDSLRNDTQI